MPRTRIKICGLTRVEDVRAAVAAGADALGFNFHPDSPRFVTPERAAALVAVVPPFVTTVGLFVDAPAARIEAVLATVPLQLLQFHGEESDADCGRHGRPWLKALRMRPELDVEAAIAAHPGAVGVLLDAYRPGVPGGTGERFDWSRLPRAARTPLVLAGGLDAHNVADAVRSHGPFAVDVSGGVEREKGIKDADAMREFVAAVRGADADRTRASSQDGPEARGATA